MSILITQPSLSRSLFDKAILTIISLLCVIEANAAPQVFLPDVYDNAAQLSMTQKFDLTVGNTSARLYTKYQGTTNGVTGESSITQDTPFLPHGHLNYRLSADWVVGLSVGQADYINYYSFKNGPLKGVEVLGFVENTAPRFSYKVNEKLAIGAGLDVYHAHDFKTVTPFGPMGAAGALSTSTKGSALGGDVGVMYKSTPTSWILLDYYSKATINTKGRANAFGQTVNTQIPFYQPATTSLSLLHFFSQKFLAKVTGRFIQYRILKTFIVTDTPFGPVQLPLNWRNTWDASVFIRYQFASQWAGITKLEYYKGPAPQEFNTGVFFTSDVAIGGVGVQYMPTKKTQVQLFGGYGGLNPQVRSGGSNGSVVERFPFVDIALTYKY